MKDSLGTTATVVLAIDLLNTWQLMGDRIGRRPPKTGMILHTLRGLDDGFLLLQAWSDPLTGDCPNGFFHEGFREVGRTCQACSENCNWCLSATECRDCKIHQLGMLTSRFFQDQNTCNSSPCGLCFAEVS